MAVVRTPPNAGSKAALVAAGLSALVPGAGHFYLRDRRRGLWFLAGSLSLALLLLAALLQDATSLLKLAFDPNVLLALLVANALVFIFRAASVIDAYRRAGGGVSRGVLGVAAIAITVVLVAPHAVFAYYDAAQHDLVTTVFASPVSSATTTTTTTPTTTTSVAVQAVSEQPASEQPAIAPGSTSTTTSTTEAPDKWEGIGRLNILLIGSDAGAGRTGVRTDTMILASVDVRSGDLALISIPRNFARVPLPPDAGRWSCDCFPPILNELYQYAENHPDLFPGPGDAGANAIKGAVSEMLGLEVHYYAMVALDGFVAMVDALGGVSITVTERIFDPSYPAEGGGTESWDLSPGTYEFDGHQALAYARIRHSSDDYDRMGRQRCVIEAMVEQASPVSLLLGFPELAEVIKASVKTDIPLAAIPDLIDLLPLVDTDRAVSLRLMPPTYVSGWTDDRFGIPDSELIREHAAIVTTLSPEEATAALGIEPLDDICG